MSPICFWSRRACSRYAALGQPVPAGSRLDAHMMGCPACREYWRSLSLLTSDLNLLVTTPRPSPRYSELEWNRLAPAPPQRGWNHLSLVGVAACGLACGWIVWNAVSGLTGQTNVPNVAANGRKVPDEIPIPEHRVRPSSTDSRVAGVVGPTQARDNSPRRRHVNWTSVSFVHRRPIHRYILWQRPRHKAAPEMRVDDPVLTWEESGRMLEAQGDPGLANVAYQAAYQEQPSDQSAFDVGRTAEESGDMGQAMDVYAGLLAAADGRSGIEKGWNP